MKPMSQCLTITARVVLPLAGFVLGLFADVDDLRPPTVVEGVVLVPLVIFLLPPLVMMLFRVEVALGAAKPPWESPNHAGRLNPLLLIQIASLLLAAVGLGATISIAWKGAAAVYYALLGWSGAVAFHLALRWLMRRYLAPQRDSKPGCS
jgi:hypothetical protein